MAASGGPEWVVREDAAAPVLVALYLRQVLGVRSPEALPPLRALVGAEVPAPTGFDAAAGDELERQWRGYWDMTVEPQAHPSTVPLELIEGFETLVALPVEGFEALRAAIEPYASAAVAYARTAHARYAAHTGPGAGSAYRGYASAIAQHERVVGRRAHSFELNVQVLPLAQRGVWWIGALTIAVTDGLRGDVVAFDKAIGPVIAELA